MRVSARGQLTLAQIRLATAPNHHTEVHAFELRHESGALTVETTIMSQFSPAIPTSIENEASAALVRRYPGDSGFYSVGLIPPTRELSWRYQWSSIPQSQFRSVDTALRTLILLAKTQRSWHGSSQNNMAQVLPAYAALERFMNQPVADLHYATPEMYENALGNILVMRDLHKNRSLSKDVMATFRQSHNTRSDPSWLPNVAGAGCWTVGLLEKLLALDPSWRLARRIEKPAADRHRAFSKITSHDLPIPALAFLARLIQLTISTPEHRIPMQISINVWDDDLVASLNQRRRGSLSYGPILRGSMLYSSLW